MLGDRSTGLKMSYDICREHAPSLSMLKMPVNHAGEVPGYAHLMEPSAVADNPGARLRQLRTLKGLTLEQVADAVGFTAQALSQIETGVTKNIRPEWLLKLCAFYDVDAYKLVLGKQKSEVVSELRRRSTRTP